MLPQGFLQGLTLILVCCLYVLPAHLLQADIAHDHKAAQLEDGTNTLLGLDANRLCKWDLRDPRGVVQVRGWGVMHSLGVQLLHVQWTQCCMTVFLDVYGRQTRVMLWWHGSRMVLHAFSAHLADYVCLQTILFGPSMDACVRSIDGCAQLSTCAVCAINQPPLQEAGDASPIVQWTGGKDFARGTNFSCMATSGAGHVVVGSRDGKIRMYSSKTLTQVRRGCIQTCASAACCCGWWLVLPMGFDSVSCLWQSAHACFLWRGGASAQSCAVVAGTCMHQLVFFALVQCCALFDFVLLRCFMLCRPRRPFLAWASPSLLWT